MKKKKEENLIKILIVDDELPFLEHMRTYDYAKHGYECIGFAGNGKEALRICMNNMPHIIISDINMPVMDGIELMKIISANFPSIKFIILTIHESFDYAQSAIENNVSAYIVKSTNIEKELFAALDKLRNNMQLEKPSEGFLYNNPLLQISENTYFWYGDFEKNRFINFFREIADKPCSIYGIKIFNREFNSKMLNRSIQTSLMEKNIPKKTVKTVFIHELLTLIISISGKDINENKIIEPIMKNISGIEGILYYGLYKKRVSTNDSFEDYIDNALKLLPYGFYSHASSLKSIESATKYCTKKIDNSTSRAWNGEMIKAGTDIDKFTKFILNTVLHKIIEEKYSPGEILSLYKAWIKKYVFNYSTENQDTSSMKIESYLTIYKMTDVFIDEMKEIIKNSKSMTYEVSSAIKYIEDNMHKYDLQLNEVSEHVHISKGYLSTLLKKDCGVGFQKLLINMRMEKAGDILLNTTKKIYEISNMVGYLNPRSFAKAFHAFYGVTPKKYKSRESKNEK